MKTNCLVHLQGSGQTDLNLYDTWRGFVSELPIFIDDITNEKFQYFNKVKKYASDRSVVDLSAVKAYMNEFISLVNFVLKVFR